MLYYINSIAQAYDFNAGDDHLRIHKLTATFGKLENKSLTLGDGLNILQAPNEAGKSTWCAFLCNMLYGLPTRDRSPLADKNRYAPWSGAAMQGRLELESSARALTLVRDTARANAPMGRFSAVYTGTVEPVPDLTGQTCGETLLGISREIFERSAFVRQAGLAVEQTAELERRIVSLITTGDEDTSYIESYERLKKQLNRRQHNKTGLIPGLDADLSDLHQQLGTVEALEQQLVQARDDIHCLTQREAGLTESLAVHDRWDAARQRQSIQTAQNTANQAAERAAQLRRRLDEENIPENDTIGRLRGAIVNLGTVRKSVDKAREDRDNAARTLYKVETAVNESPFAGQSAEGARKLANAIPPIRPKAWWLPVLCLLFGAVGTYLLSRGSYSLSATLFLGCAFFLAGLIAVLGRASSDRKKQTSYLSAYGADTPETLIALADTYGKLMETRDAFQADLAGKSAAAESLSATLTTNEQGILLEVRRFAPAAFDIPTADSLLRACAVRRRETTDAETVAREAQLRCEYQTEQAPAATTPDAAVLAPPETDRETLRRELEQVRVSLGECRSAADRLTGRLHALGDPGDLRASAEELSSRRDLLSQEYDALSLAMETLFDANTALQNRFSPALGQRAADIFSRLTGGKYHKVLLDRALSASAESGDDPLARDARFLSQGAFDQLYLSLRLAICDLVLPEATGVPLILDDALISFDDNRAQAALSYLKEVAQRRQILLFTCQGREAKLLCGDSDAAIQMLS